MKVTLLALIILICTITTPAQDKRISIVLERETAQRIWDSGTGESPATFAAIKSALQQRRSTQQVEQWLAKRCRDSCGDGPLDQCTRQFVVLAVTEETASEWLMVLESTTHQRLSRKARTDIEQAFCSTGLKLEGCR